MENKALKQYIEQKFGVVLFEIKSKLSQKYYVISERYTVDMWTVGYNLLCERLFKNYSDILDYLTENRNKVSV